jgi:DNA (cytosine-5)-methyltransferase 1
MAITFGSLFTGIGGLDLGLEQVGMQCRWQVEINPYCTKVLEKHWPDIRRYTDVREIEDLEVVDLICGGFPCQPVSVAGLRRGTEDKRWLWPEFHRIIRMVRPRYIIVENVTGLLSANKGSAMGGILRDLAESGYDAQWDRVSAESVGAPHLRWRIFIYGTIRSQSTDGKGSRAVGNGQAMADTEFDRRQGIGEDRKATGSPRLCHGTRADQEPSIFGGGWWSIEPDVGRVAHGIPSRMDRLRALGGAVLPQVAEFVGKKIMEWEKNGIK